MLRRCLQDSLLAPLAAQTLAGAGRSAVAAPLRWPDVHRAPQANEAAGAGAGPAPAAAAAAATAAAAHCCRISTAGQLFHPAVRGGGGGGEAEETACPEGTSPNAALEAELAEVEQRLAALYDQSDALQQQEAQLAEVEEHLLQ